MARLPRRLNPRVRPAERSRGQPGRPIRARAIFSAVSTWACGQRTRSPRPIRPTAWPPISPPCRRQLVMNQKLEASTLKIAANNALSGEGRRQDQRPAGLLEYRKPQRRCRREALGDARRCEPRTSRSRLGPAVSGLLPLKLIGKIASAIMTAGLGVEADLTSLKLDNILPGW